MARNPTLPLSFYFDTMPVPIEVDTSVVEDPSMQAHDLLTDIATLYCTAPGDARQTVPVVSYYFDAEKSRHQFTFMHYATDDDFVPGPDQDETSIATNYSVRSGVRRFLADLGFSAITEVKFWSRAEDMDMALFESFEEIAVNCFIVLQSEDCPGHKAAKDKLQDRAYDLINRLSEKPDYALRSGDPALRLS